jgi:hypothetical protein
MGFMLLAVQAFRKWRADATPLPGSGPTVS